MRIQSFVFNPFQENTYIIWDERSLQAAIIDPGCSDKREEQVVSRFIESEGLKLTHLLNTHMHLDHAIGDRFIQVSYGLVVECNVGDSMLAGALTLQSQLFHLPYPANVDLEIGRNLTHNQNMTIAGSRCTALHVPGHTPGHLAYYFPEEGVVFAGDVLFRSSIGRTDLPGGNHKALQNSIVNTLFALPPETDVLTGHGPSTTIGYEQTYNPYVV